MFDASSLHVAIGDEVVAIREPGEPGERLVVPVPRMDDRDRAHRRQDLLVADAV